jgi:hypothetical protein
MRLWISTVPKLSRSLRCIVRVSWTACKTVRHPFFTRAQRLQHVAQLQRRQIQGRLASAPRFLETHLPKDPLQRREFFRRKPRSNALDIRKCAHALENTRGDHPGTAGNRLDEAMDSTSVPRRSWKERSRRTISALSRRSSRATNTAGLIDCEAHML